MGGGADFSWVIPIIIGLGCWRIAEAVSKRRISLMALVSTVASFVGSYLGGALMSGPLAPPERIFAGEVIGAVVAAAVSCAIVLRAKA